MTTFNNNFPFPIPNYKRTGAFRADPFCRWFYAHIRQKHRQGTAPPMLVCLHTVAFLETIHASAGVNQLLLAGVEGMAL